jgi:hypothetical protein
MTGERSDRMSVSGFAGKVALVTGATHPVAESVAHAPGDLRIHDRGGRSGFRRENGAIVTIDSGGVPRLRLADHTGARGEPTSSRCLTSEIAGDGVGCHLVCPDARREVTDPPRAGRVVAPNGRRRGEVFPPREVVRSADVTRAVVVLLRDGLLDRAGM